MIFPGISKEAPVILWWSGGITSAVACYLCIIWFGKQNVRIIMLDTRNEDDDTYRFKQDCERWYGMAIESIFNPIFENIQDVWYSFKSLNVANGAICSSELKRQVRKAFQHENNYSYQAFGFERDEINRALAMKINYPDAKPIFPLIIELLSKKDCMKIVQDAGIRPPVTYELGFHNNNCFKTGCVQGGIGYWQKIRREFPEKFDAMAKVEHDLTNIKGQPVTMLKDQSKNGGLVFLKPHPDYPLLKDISMMKGREPEPLMECNSFCGTNDLLKKKSKAYQELNYDGLFATTEHTKTPEEGKEGGGK